MLEGFEGEFGRFWKVLEGFEKDSSDLRYVVWSCGLGFLLGVLLSALVVSSAISPFNVLSPGASRARCARPTRRFETDGRQRFDRLQNSLKINSGGSK